MKGVSEDIFLKTASPEECRRQIDKLLRDKNPALDFTSPEYQAVVSVFARLLQNNHGRLVRDDFNFTVGFYNDCRAITRQAATLKLPARFKQALREYYARAMIERGEAKDLDADTRWLNSLPDGKLVIARAPADAIRGPGVIYSESPDLGAMVTLALPEFKDLDPARKPMLLDAVCALNPWIKRQGVRTGGEKVDGVRQKTSETVSYEVPAGQPILIPSLDSLQTQAAKGEQTNPFATGKSAKKSKKKNQKPSGQQSP